MALPSAAPTPEVSRAPALTARPQLKHGEIHSTVFAAAVLTGTQYALEVQVRHAAAAGAAAAAPPEPPPEPLPPLQEPRAPPP